MVCVEKGVLEPCFIHIHIQSPSLIFARLLFQIVLGGGDYVVVCSSNRRSSIQN